MNKITLKKYIKANKKFWLKNYLLNKDIGIYNDKNDFIKKHLEVFSDRIYKVLDLKMSYLEARALYKKSLLNELKVA